MVTKPEIRDRRAEYAFHDDIVYLHETQRGLSRATVEEISALKEEPEWMLQHRLRAFECGPVGGRQRLHVAPVRRRHRVHVRHREQLHLGNSLAELLCDGQTGVRHSSGRLGGRLDCTLSRTSRLSRLSLGLIRHKSVLVRIRLRIVSPAPL